MKVKRKGITKVLTLLALMVTLIVGGGMSARAASHSYGWITSLPRIDSTIFYIKPQKSITIQVEEGKSFDLAWFFAEIGASDYYCTHGSCMKLSFKSNKSSVASVNKKTGRVTAKKKGKAVITCTYKKKNYTCTVNVLKKGGLGSKYKKINSAAEKLVKYKGKKLTSKNITAVIKASDAFDKALDSTDVYPYGFIATSNKAKRTISNKLAVPSYHEVCDVQWAIIEYISKNNPITKGNLKPASVSGVSGTDVINVTLNKAPSETEIYMLQSTSGDTSTKKDGKKASVWITVKMTDCYDEEVYTFTSERYSGLLTLTKGSKKAKITGLKTWDNKKVKLKKNYEYAVEFSEKSSKKFVVKK